MKNPVHPVYSSHTSWIETDLDAIQHNVRLLCKIAGPSTKLMAVLKADAYGHGAQLVAPAALAGGASYLALANLAEAVQLREAGIDAPMLLLGYTPPEQVRAAVAHGLAVTLFDADVARALSAAALETDRPALAHLKVDTGMSRLGIMPADALPFVRWVTTLPGVRLEGIYTHLATADGDAGNWGLETGDWGNGGVRLPIPYPLSPIPTVPAAIQNPKSKIQNPKSLALLQLHCFEELLDQLEAIGLRPPLVHMANSAALLRLHRPGGRYNLVRPGLALYGLMPHLPRSDEDSLPLRPALAWHTRIARVAELPPGTPVSYGATYVTPCWRRIATLPVGYADGLRRSPPWREVLICGQRAPVVGRVCMDYVMCDVTHIPGARVGERATLLGCQYEEVISAFDVADWLGTSVYEVITAIGGRVGRYAALSASDAQ